MSKGNIQRIIEQHLTVENSFVKSIQITNESDDSEVIVPNGYSIRFINCQMKNVTARNSAIHFFCTNVKEKLQLTDCVVSFDGGAISGILMCTNTRINIKKLPKELGTDGKESSVMITDSLDFTNTESFWNEVTWNDTGSGTTIVNSRIEMSDCKISSDAELTVSGTEWYNLLGNYNFKKEVKIQPLEPVLGATDPELAMDYNKYNTTSVSTNKIRGTAGVGAGCIVHFKGCKTLSNDKPFEVKKSELNFYDIEKIQSKKTTVEYTDASGYFSNCKIDAQESCVTLKGAGNIHFDKCELTSQKTAIDITGPGANCTVLSGKITSQEDCLSITSATVDMYGVEKVEAQQNCIKADNATCMLFGCKDLEAKENTFDLKNGAVLDSDKSEKLKGKILFKGENSSFIVRGDTKLEAEDKVVSGSGVFVSKP